MTTEEKCKLKKLLDKCPSGIATAEMDLMDFVYSTDLSYQDYMELGWMIMVRMYAYTDREIAQFERERHQKAQKIAIVCAIFAAVLLIALFIVAVIAKSS